MRKLICSGAVVSMILLAGMLIAGCSNVPAAKAPAVKSTGRPQMIEFGSTICTQCKNMEPIIKALEKKYKGRVDVIFVDVGKNPEPARKHKITLIPCQVFLDKDGKEVFRHVGFFEQEKIEARFREMGVH